MRMTIRGTGRGWKPFSKRSCSTSPGFSCRCSSVILLCLLDERVSDNLMHRRAIHPSTIYIQSSLLRVHSCHTTHAGIIAPSSLCIFNVLAYAHVNWKMLESERSAAASDNIASSHLCFYTNHLLPLSFSPAFFYVGCHLSLLFSSVLFFTSLL